MKKFKINTLITLFLILFIVVLNTYIGVYYINKAVDMYQTNTNEQLETIIVSRGDAVEDYFEMQMNLVENVTKSDYLRNYLTATSIGQPIEDKSYIDEIVQISIRQDNLNYTENLYIIDENGTVVLSNIKNDMGKPMSVDLRSYINDITKTSVSEIVNDTTLNNGEKYIMIYSPIKLDNGAEYFYFKIIGEAFFKQYTADNLFEQGFICLVDENNSVINGISFDSEQDLNLQVDGLMSYINSDNHNIVKTIRESGTFTYVNNRVPHTAYYSTVMNANITYIASVPTDVLLQSEKGMIHDFNVTIILATLFAMIISYVLLKFLLTRPMADINMTINRLLKNNKYERVIKSDTFFEMSQLSIGINQLVAKYRAEIDELESFRERYRVISENSKDITFEWNLQTGYLFYSAEWDKRFAGAYPKTNLFDAFLDLDSVHPEDVEKVEKCIEVMKAGHDTQTEFRIQDLSREYRWLLTRTTTVRGVSGELEKVVGIMIDINKMKTAQMEFMNKAMYDRLTGLYNMESFEFKIADEMEYCKSTETEMSVVFIDIDDFKHFNDKYGHEVGNEVLIYVANTLSEIAGANSGFAARFGGDEFLMCIKGKDVEAKVVSLAQEFLNSVHQLDSKLTGEILSISCSVGISIYPRDAQNAKDLVKKSDTAMYKIKRDGKDGVVLFDNETM